MNHLKYFKIFESNESIYIIKDIVSELEDYDFHEISNDYEKIHLKEYTIFTENEYMNKYRRTTAYYDFVSLIRIRVGEDPKYVTDSEILLIKKVSLRLKSVGFSVEVFTYGPGIKNNKVKPGANIPNSNIIDIVCR